MAVADLTAAPSSAQQNRVSRLDRAALLLIAIASGFVLIFAASVSPWVVAGMLVLALRAWQTKDLAYVKISILFLISLQLFTYGNQLVIRLTPHTIDAELARLDFGIGQAFSDWWKQSAIATAIVKVVYAGLPLPIATVLAYAPKRRPALRAFIISALIAMPCYYLFPATGPAWVGTAAPRNCMPSFHFTWAILSCWYSPKWLRLALFVNALLVAAATLVLREHYVLDLIVAIPVSVGICWYAG